MGLSSARQPAVSAFPGPNRTRCVAKAKASGTKSGKAFGRPRTAPEVEQRIREALATPGRPGFHKIAEQFGVATGTVQRIAGAI